MFIHIKDIFQISFDNLILITWNEGYVGWDNCFIYQFCIGIKHWALSCFAVAKFESSCSEEGLSLSDKITYGSLGESKISRVVFGWQRLDLDLDLKSIDLKCLDLKSFDFKISCLGLFKQKRIWNSSFQIPLFGCLNLDMGLDFDLKSIKYIF